MHFIILIFGSQVPRDRDLFLREITQTCTRASVVKPETPHCGVKMQADEGIRPLGYPVQIRHGYFLEIWKMVLFGVGEAIAVVSNT
ncbi:MAG: hypothetical protein RR713_05115, partial [Aurantimicrobium sp.]